MASQLASMIAWTSESWPRLGQPWFMSSTATSIARGSAAGTSSGRSTRTYSKVPQGAFAGQSVTQNCRPCLCLKAHSRGMIPDSLAAASAPVHRAGLDTRRVIQPTLATASPERETRLGSRRDGMGLELKVVAIDKPADVNLILGQSHFIKTVEDLYEALVSSVPGIKFGLAFCESSGACLVRTEGTDEALKAVAVAAAQAIGAGHSFVIVLKDAFPVNVLNAVKACPEVCRVYCATANPLQVIVAETEQGRGILGVVDGSSPKGVEDAAGIAWRQELLQKFGYKR